MTFSSSVLDLTPYEGSYGMRLGTRTNGAKNLHLLRKMLHFKGTAIHTASADTIEDLVNSKACLLVGVDCPRLIVSSTPACTATQFYYRMLPGFFANSDQEITDSSGNNLHGINGASSAVDNDCTA